MLGQLLLWHSTSYVTVYFLFRHEMNQLFITLNPNILNMIQWIKCYEIDQT